MVELIRSFRRGTRLRDGSVQMAVLGDKFLPIGC